jgi:hypothetical protein
MNIKITKMWTNPELSDVTEVITQVTVLFTGEHSTHEINFALDCEDLSNLSKYETLTEEQVANWVTTQLRPGELEYIETIVNEAPSIKSNKVLPWANTA